MIKVGITGGESADAGELIRLLLLHPEVELMFVESSQHAGKNLSSVHKGIIGDSNLNFTSSVNYEPLDVLFITSGNFTHSYLDLIPESVKIIALSHLSGISEVNISGRTFVPGVSEMFRKQLVRGATTSRVLPSPVVVSLISLYPLALNLLLNDSIEIEAAVPRFRQNTVEPDAMKDELELLLKNVQLSFSGFKKVAIVPSHTVRAISVDIRMDCGISKEEIEKVFNSVYDDHNFSFLTDNIPAPEEVSGTQKCLIYIEKPSEETLRIHSVADAVLRGGAGDAVHVLNLLLGLYEKTGLSLNASLAFKNHINKVL